MLAGRLPVVSADEAGHSQGLLDLDQEEEAGAVLIPAHNMNIYRRR
jgi:hypothetical protein